LKQIHLVVFEKNAPLIPKNDVTESKGKRLGYSNYQLKSCSQVKGQFQTCGKHGFQKPLINRIGKMIAQKRNKKNADIIRCLKTKIRFSLLKSKLVVLRGFRGNPKTYQK